VQEVILENSGS